MLSLRRLLTRRNCANCRDSDWVDWRYCADCWRMVAKTFVITLATAAATGLVKVAIAWVIHRLF